MLRTHRFINRLSNPKAITNLYYIFNSSRNRCFQCSTIEYCKSNSKCVKFDGSLTADIIIANEIMRHRNTNHTFGSSKLYNDVYYSRNNSTDFANNSTDFANNSICFRNNSNDDYEDEFDD